MNKIKKKNILRIVCFALVVIFLMMPIVLFSKIFGPEGKEEVKLEECFLELWNIDTFEGGKSSRGVFLEKQAITFQNQNSGVYIICKTLNAQQAKLQLSSGSTPDFVSFGVGIGGVFRPLAQELINFDVRAELKNNFAVPWCMGGYVLCSKKYEHSDVKNLLSTGKVFGFGNQNNMAVNVMKSYNGNTENLYEKSMQKDYSSYSAYQDFLVDKFDVLVGTQRDYFRLSNRLSLGALNGCNFMFTEGFSDLIQWFSVLTSDKSKQEIINKYISFILSDFVQKKLENIGMFSVTNCNIYTDETLAKFEKSLQKEIKTQNPFITEIEINEERNKVLSKVFGVESENNKDVN